MKQPSKATARVQSITDPRLEKPLLHLHAAIDVDSFWQAVQDVIGVALQTRFIGLTLQHSPIFPRIARSTAKLPGKFFPIAPVERLAILRLDGDMYSSTMDSLLNLYPKLSVGGYAIIDDYGEIESCRKAVDDFRASNKIEASLSAIDLSGVYWKKKGLTGGKGPST